jgi:hypothetical protein
MDGGTPVYTGIQVSLQRGDIHPPVRTDLLGELIRTGLRSRPDEFFGIRKRSKKNVLPGLDVHDPNKTGDRMPEIIEEGTVLSKRKDIVRRIHRHGLVSDKQQNA